jgi:uncharacterized protein YraI
MKNALKLFIAAGTLAIISSSAHAAVVATAVDDISVRSGPGENYPEVGLATRGSDAVLDGCIEGSNWCRIDVNGLRGWAFAESLHVMYEGSPVILEDHRSDLDIPVVTYETTAGSTARPAPGDEKIGRVEDVDAITPPETVIAYMDEHPADPIYIQEGITVGAILPSDAPLVDIPDYEYQYVRVNDVPVLVEPQSRRVVYVYR